MPTAIRPPRAARSTHKKPRTVRKPHAPRTALPANFTVHGLDPDLARALRDYADRSRSSLNAAAKELLRRSLGLPTADEQARLEEWKSVFGCLPDEDAAEMLETLKAFEQIDEDTWENKWT